MLSKTFTHKQKFWKTIQHSRKGEGEKNHKNSMGGEEKGGRDLKPKESKL